MKLQDASPKAPAIQAFSGALEETLRRELVYAGDLLVFKGVGPMAELCVLTDELIREALGASDPAGTQFGMRGEDYVARVGELQKQRAEIGHTMGEDDKSRPGAEILWTSGRSSPLWRRV